MISRRRLLGAAAALGTAATLPLSSLSPAAAESARQGMVAVRVFPTYRNEVYGEHEVVLARLGELGVKRMSHRLTPDMPADAILFTQRAFNEHGIKSWLTVGLPNDVLTAAEWDDIQATLTGPLAGMVELVSGYNEPNNEGVKDWPQRSVAHNRELFRRFNGVIPKIGTPQLWSGNLDKHDADVKLLKNAGLAGSFNTISWHLYPRTGGAQNVRNINRFESVYFGAFGVYPVVCTESGYTDAPGLPLGGSPYNCSPDEKAAKVTELVDEYVVNRGYGISYFELLDDVDPAGTNREANLGLVECPTPDPTTWYAKPSFAALRDKVASYA